MTHLKIYENETLIDINTGELIDFKGNISFDSTYMLHVPSQLLLFDKKWERITEVSQYLHNRLYVKRQAWNTVESKGFALKLFYDFLEEMNEEYKTVTVSIINDFIAWLFKKDISDEYVLGKTSQRTEKTVNTYISHIRDFYKYVKHKYQITDPFSSEYEEINYPSTQAKGFYAHTLSTKKVSKSMFKIKERGKKPITILGKNELRMLIDAAKLTRDKLMLELMIYSGMRIGEVLNLKVQAIGVANLNEEVQTLPMYSSKNDGKRKRLKTGVRDIYIPPKLMLKLDRYYTDVWLNIVEKKDLNHDYFFISEGNRNKGQPLTYGAVRSRFKTLFNKTGIDANPHDFRHTFATNQARMKTDIATLAKLLGHKNPSSVSIYIKIAEIEEIKPILNEFYETFDLGL